MRRSHAVAAAGLTALGAAAGVGLYRLTREQPATLLWVLLGMLLLLALGTVAYGVARRKGA